MPLFAHRVRGIPLFYWHTEAWDQLPPANELRRFYFTLNGGQDQGSLLFSEHMIRNLDMIYRQEELALLIAMAQRYGALPYMSNDTFDAYRAQLDPDLRALLRLKWGHDITHEFVYKLEEMRPPAEANHARIFNPFAEVADLDGTDGDLPAGIPPFPYTILPSGQGKEFTPAGMGVFYIDRPDMIAGHVYQGHHTLVVPYVGLVSEVPFPPSKRYIMVSGDGKYIDAEGTDPDDANYGSWARYVNEPNNKKHANCIFMDYQGQVILSMKPKARFRRNQELLVCYKKDGEKCGRY